METQFVNELLKLNNILAWLGILNVITFLLMWYDKHEAKMSQWRISEKTLFVFTLLRWKLRGNNWNVYIPS